MPRTVLIALLSVGLTGCQTFGGLTDEEQDDLAQFQANAQAYYHGQRYDQALDMVRKGLDIDAENYKLMSVAGWCYLQTAERDSRRLREAERYFDSVFAQRDPSDHEPHALLGYAATKQRLGREHARLADTLRREAETRDLSTTEQTIRTARADEHSQRARSYWSEAVRTLQQLIERQDLLRFAHKLLMETYVEIGDYEKAVEQGDLCLQQNKTEQASENARIRETPSVQVEQASRAMLRELIDQEVRVRAALAEMHFRRQAYELAVEQLDALLLIDPTRSTDYYNRADALERLGRSEEARRDYEKFLGTTRLPSNDERVAHAHEFTRAVRGE